MSTRTTIRFSDESPKTDNAPSIGFYKHHDGYPGAMLPLLMEITSDLLLTKRTGDVGRASELFQTAMHERDLQADPILRDSGDIEFAYWVTLSASGFDIWVRTTGIQGEGEWETIQQAAPKYAAKLVQHAATLMADPGRRQYAGETLRMAAALNDCVV